MGTITVVRPAEDRWFFNEVDLGAEARAGQAGHEVVVCRVAAGEDAVRRAADCIEDAFTDPDSLGAVVAGFQHRGGGSDRYLTWRRPVVLIGGSTLGYPVVSFDDVGVGRTATQHLLELGHQHIAHLTGSLDPDEAMVYMRRRARGYRMTLESAGLTPQIVESDLHPTALAATARELLTGPRRPTAVFAAWDELAFVVLDAAEELGLQIGRDLSVIGVNDHPDAAGRELTTVRHRPAEVGAVSVEMILEGLAAGPDPAKSRLTSSTFIKRGSTRRHGALVA